MPALLALDGVFKSFGSLVVIDGLSLAVEEGEALGVIGPNGAGKTTALNLLIGRLRPDRGAVRFAGREVTRLPPHARCRAGIALTHQIPHPFEALTVFENVLVGASYGRAGASPTKTPPSPRLSAHGPGAQGQHARRRAHAAGAQAAGAGARAGDATARATCWTRSPAG